MQTKGWQVTAYEPDENARKIARKKYAIHSITEEALFSLPEKCFNVITLWHVLEHVHDLDKYATHLKKILQDDGCIFIAVPNYRSLDANKYQKDWAAYDVPRHLYHFSPESMNYFLEKTGFVLINRKALWLDSFYISLLSEKNKGNTMQYIKAVLNGIASNFKAMNDARSASSILYIAKKKIS